MNLLRAPVVVFASLAGSVLLAQVPTVSMRAASVLTAQAQVGPVPIVQTLPIGPLPAAGAVSAGDSGPGSAVAATLWHCFVSPTVAFCQLEQRLEVNGVGSCASGPNDVVFAITSPIQRPVALIVRTTKAATPGVPSTTAEVDVGNDGLVEITGAAAPAGSAFFALIGPQPFEVRVRFAGGLTGTSGISSASDVVQLTLTPANQMGIFPATNGCRDNTSTLDEAWDQNGIVFDHQALSPAPLLTVAVLGLSLQIVQLPNASVLLPCLLLPSPDLVVLMPPGGLALPLPPAVRPITNWAQCVLLEPTGITTSNGFAVAAY
jgi:hypothetical protein